MKLRRLFSCGIAFLALALLAGSSAWAQKRPNVVVLMGDDLGWSDFGAYTGVGKPSAIPHRTSIA